MQIDRFDEATAVAPPEPGFTGDVRISGYFSRLAPSQLAGAIVRFAAGARTPWKVNPVGQTLIILSGAGQAQQEGGEVVALRAGDIVWCPPGVRHWDGAAADDTMTYVAVHETCDGVGVTFGASVDAIDT